VVPQRPQHEGGISNATQRNAKQERTLKGIVIQLRMYKEKADQKTKENALVGLESWQ
jgi:hypothetical protein